MICYDMIDTSLIAILHTIPERDEVINCRVMYCTSDVSVCVDQ